MQISDSPRVLPSYKTTPAQDPVNQVAHSYLASWQDKHMENLNRALTIVKVTSVIGAGISVYTMSIPGVVLCIAALTICFIGSNAIRREQIARCTDVCLQLENWLTCFKQAGEELKEKLESLNDYFKRQNAENLELDEEIQDILTVIEKLPANDWNELTEKLQAVNLQLFGERISFPLVTTLRIFRSQLNHCNIQISNFEETAKQSDEKNYSRRDFLRDQTGDFLVYLKDPMNTAKDLREEIATFRTSL